MIEYSPCIHSLRKGTLCGWFLSALLLSGCDEFPSRSPAALKPVTDAVSDTGRVSYDWKVRNGQFEIARPTSFKLAELLDTSKIEASLKLPEFKEPTQAARPDWMEDDLYRWYRRYSEPHWPTTVLFELTIDEHPQPVHACLNADGTRLCIITDKLAEWDLTTQKAIRSYLLPLTDARPIHYSPEDDSILFFNADDIVGLRLSDGGVANRWRPKSGKISSVVRARAADVVAVVTNNQSMIALSNNFSKASYYQGNSLDSPRVAVHPDGKWVLGILPSGFVRWRLDIAGNPAEEISTVQPMVNSKCIPISGKRFDRFVDPFFIFEENPLADKKTLNQFHAPNFLPSCISLNASAATVDGSQDWLVVFAHKGDFAGKVANHLQDFSLQSYEYSVPWEIPFESDFKILASDWSAQRIAFQVGGSIKVVERRAWVEPTGRNLMQIVRSMFSQGRVDEIEMLAKLLREQKVHRFERTGEQLFAQCAAAVGDQWAYWEQQPASAEVTQRVEQWHSAGSEFAMLASIRRHVNAGLEARGLGLANTVTPEGWDSLSKHIESALGEIGQLLQTNQISLSLIDSFITCARYGDIPAADCEPLLKQGIELYPQSADCLASFCTTLLPRWGGREGEGGALVNAVADSFPAPFGDVLYTRVALRMVAIFGQQILEPHEAGFSRNRVLSNSKTLLDRGVISREEVEILMGLARSAGQLEYIDKLAKYHYQHFGLVGNAGYRDDILSKLAKTREQAFPKDYDPMK